jgi:Asp-tRNA(Asn)/Glu-tRNA(Gln) amidotransferase B subunit
LKDRVKYDVDCISVDEIDYIGYEKYNQMMKDKELPELETRRGVAVVEMDFKFQGDSKFMKQSNAYTVLFNEKEQEYYIFSKPIKPKRFSNDDFDWRKKFEVKSEEHGKEKIKIYKLTFGVTLQIFKKLDNEKTIFKYFHGLILDSINQSTFFQ